MYIYTRIHLYICVEKYSDEKRNSLYSVKYISLCVDKFSGLLYMCVCVSRWVGSCCNLTPDVPPLSPLTSELFTIKYEGRIHTHTYNHPPWTSSQAVWHKAHSSLVYHVVQSKHTGILHLSNLIHHCSKYKSRIDYK